MTEQPRKIEPVKEAEPPADENVRPKELVIELRKPVQAFGATLKELTFRRPTGGDIMALGDVYPYHIEMTTGAYRASPGPMGRIMSTLAQVPLSTIQSMDGDDFDHCSELLLYGFFLRR